MPTWSLVSYFNQDPDEATSAGYSSTIVSWLWFFSALDKDIGIQFAIQQLESDDALDSEMAYKHLSESVYDKDRIESAMRNVSTILRQFPFAFKEQPRASTTTA